MSMDCSFFKMYFNINTIENGDWQLWTNINIQTSIIVLAAHIQCCLEIQVVTSSFHIEINGNAINLFPKKCDVFFNKENKTVL